ncbi:MAG: fumarylacetoacetate hydrolase family protein [Saprospiraceae bacterium]
MKCIRFGLPGAEKPGILDAQGLRRDVSAFGEDYDERFFGTNGLQRLAEWLEHNLDRCPVVPPETRLGPPFCRPSKIVCVGLNYALHAKESGMAIPAEPVLFFKSTTALCGPCDDLVIPPGSEKTDWEVELAVVIGKEASYVPLESAMEYVAGYTIHNDYSERAYQLERSGQWVKGKSCDTFAPMGPALVSRDEIADPQHLHLWLKLNGETMQDSNTSDMVYGVPFLIHYISQFMRLLPGDVLSTGTPFGVGMGLSPQRYLRPGDVVELGIEGLGECRQKAVAK